MAQSQTDRNGANTTPPTTPAGLQAAIDASAASATASAASATAAATSAADAAAQLASKASLAGATFTGGVNLARSSIVQHATTMNLGALSNTVDGTGSAVTVTAIVNAPQAGAIRRFYGLANTVWTNNAMFAVDGNANFTFFTGDYIDIEPVTPSTYKVHPFRADGTPIVNNTAIMRNRIINGAMKVDQRNVGASQTFTAAAALAYCVDRYYGFCTGANISGQRITLANAQNRYRLTGLAAVTGVGFGQRIESFNCMDLAGGNANMQVKLSSSSLTAITWTAYYATTADTFGTLATPTRTQIATGSFTITATEATYNAQMAIPAAATTGIEIVFTGGALLATQTLTIGDVQFEAGNAATSFEQTNMFANLANCQRYYFRIGDTYAVQAYADAAGRQLTSTYNFPVTLRAIPVGLTGGYSGGVNATQASFVGTVSSAVAVLSGTAIGGFSATLTWGAFPAEL